MFVSTPSVVKLMSVRITRTHRLCGREIDVCLDRDIVAYFELSKTIGSLKRSEYMNDTLNVNQVL